MSDTITVTGNLAADPERRTTQKGDVIAAFRVGSTHRRFDRDSGTWVDAFTNWYAVSAFRALGEHALASLRKGDRVVLTGTLRLREWDNGTKQGTTAEVDADAIGHDLRWGTTSYRSATTSPGVVDAPPVASADPASHEDRAGGRVPGDVGAAQNDPSAELAVMLAEPQWAGGDGVETPF